ncbi:MAG: hypothetical protein ABGW74_09085 [Campylobacterales bacterium]
MYAVEFEAPIENGIVHIPKEYQELQQTKNARFVVMYDTKDTNDEILDNFKTGIEELKLIKQGKLDSKSIEDFLDEL